MSLSLFLLGNQTGEDGHGGVVFQNGCLTGFSIRSIFCNFLRKNLVFNLFCFLYLSLFFSVLCHWIKHSWHLARPLIDINSVILFSLSVGDNLKAGATSICLFFGLVFNHHVLVLLCEHLPRRDIDCYLSLFLFLLLNFRLLLQGLLSLLIFFLRNSLHLFKFILLFLQGFGSRLSIRNYFWELIHVLKRSVFLLEALEASGCLLRDGLSLSWFLIMLDIRSIIDLLVISLLLVLFWFIFALALRLRLFFLLMLLLLRVLFLVRFLMMLFFICVRVRAARDHIPGECLLRKSMRLNASSYLQVITATAEQKCQG